ncbi:hypothetical protein Zmor_002937 [Zophobas morio]|uniref:Uncharacterized protein n=1 Tax=Zophobas morio TaxID=2755281 RepID=A0AA38HLF3_9CUCU|nr:hypothetical protein Zmor_002937 [Zophobas morio]
METTYCKNFIVCDIWTGVGQGNRVSVVLFNKVGVATYVSVAPWTDLCRRRHTWSRALSSHGGWCLLRGRLLGRQLPLCWHLEG